MKNSLKVGIKYEHKFIIPKADKFEVIQNRVKK